MNSWFQSLLFLVVLVLESVRTQFSQPGLCVTKCICIQQTDQMVACNKADQVSAIPVNVPRKYSRLMIQNSEFFSPTILKRNMTGLEHINYLKVVYCGIQAVEENAFENMAKLEYLDLSHNRIKVIAANTFAGLVLKSLHLMENAGMRLEANSFAGLKVREINLRSNLIGRLHSDQFQGTGVQRLYLFNNSLRSLDRALATLFDRPGYLVDVTKNPLHCDCHLRWMARNLRAQPPDQVKYVNITCSTPAMLSERSLHTLSDLELDCPRPHIRALAVDLGSEGHTQLSCTASSSSPSSREPEIAWTYEENGQQKVFRKIVRGGETLDDGESGGPTDTSFSVNVSVAANERRTFTCSTWSRDDGGQSQKVTVQIRTPRIEARVQVPEHGAGGVVTDRRPVPGTMEDGGGGSSYYLFTKQFTILEMVGAVVGTFALTLLLLFLVARFLRLYRYRLAKSASLKPYWAHNPPLPPSGGTPLGQDSSMYSQPISHCGGGGPGGGGDYDLPRVCETHTFPPPPSFDHIEFLDFKNHNKLYPGS